MTSAVAGTPGPDATDALNSLVDVLGEEQRLLERLRYTLAQGAFLVAAGESRFLAAAAEEIDATEYELGMVEVGRALIVAELADHLGLDDDQPTLRALLRVVPAPLRPVLANRREDMLRLSDEISTLAEAGGEMAAAGANRISAAIESFDRTGGGAPAGYSPDGSPASGDVGSAVADRRL